jgi:hypothetical protein
LLSLADVLPHRRWFKKMLTDFAPFIDRHDIKAVEPWEERLGDTIAQSNTVGFVVKPEVVKSEGCIWEIERTVHLLKRPLTTCTNRCRSTKSRGFLLQAVT